MWEEGGERKRIKKGTDPDQELVGERIGELGGTKRKLLSNKRPPDRIPRMGWRWSWVFLWDPKKSHRLLKQRRLKEQSRVGTQPKAVPRTSRTQQQHPQPTERRIGVVVDKQRTPQPQPRKEPIPQPRKNPPAPTTTTEPPPTATQPPRPIPRTRASATDRSGVE